ncbi:hypothetical protein [[Mycobacterium] holstebronense]|uniref:Immunity protein 63 domain-containing protein n=1 Tax=[Mycobacterium] holstebronense TaxID=3064288 RepID=A0ABN9N361_9MYCO|nr:hypothetical protein [Mycolicibacter sp. MU0102]CAJ1497925.1 hypothetical protein MU0102_000588 [Mycolicibacter sp. MU0102]
MGEGLMLVNEFIEEVRRIVDPFLSGLGFAVEEVDEFVDEGGLTSSVAYYRGPDCKIQVYHYSREGEINAMIAPLSAPNELGAYGRSKKWRHLSDFADTADLPLEVLVRKLREERAACDTTSKRLEWLTRRIAEDLDSARTAIVQS